MNKSFLILPLAAAVFLGGCAGEPPTHAGNLCSVFQDKDSWYAAAHRTHQKYGIPIHVAMAILADRDRLVSGEERSSLWSSVLFLKSDQDESGYLSVSDAVWDEYKDQEGSFLSSRSDFEDALDFMGWFMVQTKARSGVAYSDSYNQYINYREGWDAYAAGDYKGKDWLSAEAQRVEDRAESFKQQLLHCNLY